MKRVETILAFVLLLILWVVLLVPGFLVVLKMVSPVSAQVFLENFTRARAK